MLAILSILVSSSLALVLFCFLKLLKLSTYKKIHLVEPIKNKKMRKFLITLMIIFSMLIIIAISLFLSFF